jgi:prolyl-tRNA synthetase
MRGREFYMKDGYNFDLTAKTRSTPITGTWSAICGPMSGWGCRRSRCAPIPARSAATTHEFLMLAETGESEVFYDSDHSIWRLATGRSIIDDRAACAAIVDTGQFTPLCPHRRDP